MLAKEDIEKIRADLPKEAVQEYRGGFKNPKTGESKTLTGYKPQYIIERLNDAFGHDGWDFEVVKMSMEEGCAWCLGRLSVYFTKYDPQDVMQPVQRFLISKKEQIGSTEYRAGEISYGDAMKGAATNCLEKCASLLDIGHIAYKGLENRLPAAKSSTKEGQALDNADSLKTELKVLCKEYQIGAQAFKTLTKTVLKSEKEKDFTEEELKSLVEYVKKNKSPF